ncbi:Nse1 non-SMC component of SMC5-6 complex-domain-containing protein [Jimgerdemannia flammicorona]|uniref:Nse1 non-SMC component of SMC5-6 complex-domain-containing protein n=2 Tax=Jimgerdemannia flammicorona TaxID=994334 RepID=A0A433A0F4_9FUNG|nr:Nse1 non-SMC component of SMC5-6 complex-domain-containing protein [Jimgerdemannia flammicorona]RUS16260.1 Nse1 non-SMC component of SMC5-6 complex-domain-containing protein [Jimgerdemannia flammicorona]
MAPYTDAHRLFLQALISHRILKEEYAIQLYRNCCNLTGEEVDDERFLDFIATLNDSVGQFDMEIRKMHDETTGEPNWALVNTNGDEIAQLATEYTASEIAYFKRLIDLIVRADDDAFSVTSIVALREASKLKTPITKSAAEALLDKFVDDRWLIKARNGRYSMDIRCLLELQGYLRGEYEDEILECTLCLDILTKGQRCDVQNCSARLHHHCARNYFGPHRGEETVCMTCKTTWYAKNVVGDDGQASVAGGGVSRRRGRAVLKKEKDDENVMDVEGGLDEEQEEELIRRPRKKVDKGKGKAPARMVVDNDE